MKNKQSGFTLIEIMIALFVFSIVATITTSALLQMFSVRNQIDLQSRKLRDLQIALTIIERDIGQMINRPIIDSNASELPGLHQFNNYSDIDFTRAGFSNPNADKKRSTLQRVGYRFDNGLLIRDHWKVLDRAYDSEPLSRTLLDNVESIKWQFLTDDNIYIEVWSDNEEKLPKAIELTLTLNGWGNIVRLFTIPGY